MQSVAGGKANVLDVVTGVAETEVAIDGLVAVGAGLRRNHADADLMIQAGW